MEQDTLPIPSALVKYLERIYPDRCPDSDMTEREIWMAAGQAELVRGLRIRLDEQEENVLET